MTDQNKVVHPFISDLDGILYTGLLWSEKPMI